MNNKQLILIWLVLCAALFFILGYQLGQKEIQAARAGFIPKITVLKKEPPAPQTVDFSLFWDVWERLPKDYVDKSKIDASKMLYGAISGMVSSVGDPYTSFLSPEQNKSTKEELSGTYEGVGIQLGYKDSKLVVMAPLKGTPAEKAGVKAGSFILKIGDRDTTGISLPEAVELIRGPADTSITLTFQREGQEKPFELKLTRAQILIRSVEIDFKDDIAVIGLARFGEQTNQEWDQSVQQAIDKNAKGIVLDVRNNPGGFLQGTIYIGSEFLDGTILQVEKADGTKEKASAIRRGKLLKIPVVVLINGGSASASEIVAGAIWDRGRGKLVGEKSFGKGTVQEAEDLAGGAGLHITTAKWLLPSGKWINSTGLAPDIEIKMPEDLKPGQDPQLDKALEMLR